MAVEFDPYYKWLGILPKDQPPHYYRLLGIEVFENDVQVIESAADRQLSFLRKYQSGEYASPCQKLLNEVSRARLCLLKSSTKSAYDATLREQLERDDPFAAIIDEFSEDALPPPQKARKKVRSGSSQKKAARNEFLIPAAVGGGLLILAVAVFVFFRGGRPNPPAAPRPDSPAPVIAAPANPVNRSLESPPDRKTTQNTTPPAFAKNIDLLPRLKPEHQLVGEWKIAPNRLETVGYLMSRQIKLPVDPPVGEYTIHLRGTRLETPGAEETLLGLIVVYGDRRALVAIDIGLKTGVSGIHLVDGIRWDNNQTALPGFQTQIGRPFDLDVIVREHGIEARVDGRTVIDWQGSPYQLSLGYGWTNSADGQLYFARQGMRSWRGVGFLG